MHMSVLSPCMYVYYRHVWCSQRPEKDIGSLETGIIDCGCCDRSSARTRAPNHYAISPTQNLVSLSFLDGSSTQFPYHQMVAEQNKIK